MYRNNNKVFSQQQFKHPDDPQQLLSGSSQAHTAPYSIRRGKLLILLTVALLIFAFCFLPWPSGIDLNLSGGEIDRNGTLIQEGNIRLQGCHYEYLLRDDRIKLAVALPGLTLDNNTWQKMTYSTVLGDFMYASQLVFVDELSEFTLCRISLANDHSWCLIQTDNHLFFGTSDPGLTAADVIAANPLLIN